MTWLTSAGVDSEAAQGHESAKSGGQSHTSLMSVPFKGKSDGDTYAGLLAGS